MNATPFVLLVNPWITDFAGHDYWAKPLGLLMIAALLREGGVEVGFVDCLDRFDPDSLGRTDILPPDHQKFGTGKYQKTPLPTPVPIADVPRRYFRYGIHPDSFRKKLSGLPRPDLILVTGAMTYWYPGIQESIRVLRENLPDIPIWLGGLYTRLCPDHARKFSGADEVIDIPLDKLRDRLETFLRISLTNRLSWESLRACPPPAVDLIAHRSYAPLLTGLGCPYRCPYCASPNLWPRQEKKTADQLIKEISWLHGELGVSDLAFYDDALLIDAERTLQPALEWVIRERLPLRFHTPNALHVRALSPAWCELLKASGFTTVHLGLETTSPARQERWGGKVDLPAFERAVRNLSEAGFDRKQIGVYLLAGMPDQTPGEVAEAIRLVAAQGCEPRLSEFSPIPGTLAFDWARGVSRFDLVDEPLTHNAIFFACRRPDFTYNDLTELKRLARQTRQKMRVTPEEEPP